MKKYKVLVVLACVALLAIGFVAPAVAGKGPVAKVTGGVDLEYMPSPGLYTRHASFNAHEYAPGKPAKGNFVWIQRDLAAGQVAKFTADVVRVAVSGNVARFVCVVKSHTDPANIGRKLYVHVEDGGSPGAGNDVFKLSWDNPTFDTEYNVIGGNLVVH